AVVIGAAFGKVIDAIVKDVIMPLIGHIFAIAHVPTGYENWNKWGFPIGHLIAEVINFLIIALAVFVVIVKLVGTLMKKAAAPPAPSQPMVKECPRCLSMIPLKATRCAHCTVDLA